MQEGYRGVSLPAELVEAVENYAKESGQYKSIAQFVAEAVRLRLETLQKKVGVSAVPSAC